MLSEEEKISCPYCGENITILVDTSVVPQEYIEDCQVCCQPIEIEVLMLGADGFSVNVRHQDDC